MNKILLILNTEKSDDSTLIWGLVVIAFLVIANWNNDSAGSGGSCSSGCGGGCSFGCGGGCGS